MSQDDEGLKDLLDGKLSADDLEDDPMLSKLAERIYGEDFLEAMGLSRGDAQRALSESLHDDEDDDLLVEVIPGSDLEDIDPFDHPIHEDLPDAGGTRGVGGLVAGVVVVGAAVANMFGAMSFLGGSCSGGGCPSDGHTRLNWASSGNFDSGWGWSPSLLDGSYGIPDILMITLGVLILIKHFRK